MQHLLCAHTGILTCEHIASVLRGVVWADVAEKAGSGQVSTSATASCRRLRCRWQQAHELSGAPPTTACSAFTFSQVQRTRWTATAAEMRSRALAPMPQEPHLARTCQDVIDHCQCFSGIEEERLRWPRQLESISVLRHVLHILSRDLLSHTDRRTHPAAHI